MKEPISKSISPSPSAANRSEPDRSQTGEIILMLHLSMGQIDLALQDSTASVAELTDSFTSISAVLSAIREAVHQLPDTPEKKTAKSEMESLLGDIRGKISQAIMAFQFYDRLSQRLTQVSRNLEVLGELVNDSRRLNDPIEWVALRKKIREKYVTEDDKRLFDTLMETRDIRKALAEIVLSKQEHQHQPEGDIELF